MEEKQVAVKRAGNVKLLRLIKIVFFSISFKVDKTKVGSLERPSRILSFRFLQLFWYFVNIYRFAKAKKRARNNNLKMNWLI